MNKSELIREVATKADMTITDVSKVLSSFEEVVKAQIVEKKEEVKFAGFINVKPEFKKSRKVRNPKTGEEMMSKEHYAVKIKPLGKWF